MNVTFPATLQKLSIHITSEEQYRSLGIQLNMPLDVLDSIRRDNESHITDAVYWMLRHWQRLSSQREDSELEIHEKLQQALIAANMASVARNLGLSEAEEVATGNQPRPLNGNICFIKIL